MNVGPKSIEFGMALEKKKRENIGIYLTCRTESPHNWCAYSPALVANHENADLTVHTRDSVILVPPSNVLHADDPSDGSRRMCFLIWNEQDGNLRIF